MLSGVSVSNLAAADFLHQELSHPQSSWVAGTTSPLQHTGSWLCEVLLQVDCSDLLAKPPSPESHPLIRKSARMRVKHSLFQCFRHPDSFVMLFLTFFCSPPVVALNIMGRKQQPWLQAISLFPPPWKLPSKPTTLVHLVHYSTTLPTALLHLVVL